MAFLPEPPHNLWLCGHTHAYARNLPGSDSFRTFACETYRPKLKRLPFAVTVNDGPGNNGPENTALLVRVERSAVIVQAMTPDGEVFDHFSVDPDGRVTELGNRLKLVEAQK